MSKNITINNPNLASWLWLKHKKYEKIMKKFKKGYEYESRNNQEARNLFVDIITIIVFSKKSKYLDKLSKVSDKDLSQVNLMSKIKSKDMYLVENIVDNDDNKELKIASNELANKLKYGKLEEVIYWYNWIEKLSKFKKKNNIPFDCKKREIKDIQLKYFGDWIWIIWKIILNQSEYMMNSQLNNEINALFNIYKWKFSSSTKSKKQFIIFHSFILLKEFINWKVPIIEYYEFRVQACCNINQLYKLKKNDELQNNVSKNIITVKESEQELLLVQEKEKIEYEKINEIVKKKPQIEIKTEKKGKPIKIKVKDNEKDKQEAMMMERLELFNKIVYYNSQSEKKSYRKKKEHEYKNIKYKV